MVTDDLVPRPIVCSRQILGRHRQADSIRDALAKRTSGDFDTISVAGFGVTRSQRVDLTELLEVVQGQLVTQEMEQDVLKRASVVQLFRTAILLVLNSHSRVTVIRRAC